jgi:hypothetical protein
LLLKKNYCVVGVNRMEDYFQILGAPYRQTLPNHGRT